MRRAGIIAAACSLAVVVPAHAQQDFYVCVELNTEINECVTYAAVLDGIASFEQFGITTEGIGFMIAFGMGLVMVFFGSGLALGHVIRSFKLSMKGD